MKVEGEYPPIPVDSSCLVKRHLSRTLYNELIRLKTPSGFTLSQAIRSGVENPDSSIGFYAGDPSSYDLFGPLLKPIIQDYHGSRAHCLEPDFSILDLPDPDPGKKFILSTRIRIARNLKNTCFPPHISTEDRSRLTQRIIRVFENLSREFAGRYYDFNTLDTETEQKLTSEKLMFPRGDRFQESAGITRDFPRDRGIYISKDKTLRIWVNEEDHLRIISQQPDSDLAAVFNRIGKVLPILGKHLSFCRNDTWGFLTSCPTNIGTTMRAGVHIRLEKLEHHPGKLQHLVNSHDLQIRGTAGEKTRVKHAVFDISNRRRLGLTEKTLVKKLHKGLCAIIDAEKNL